jgi:chromosome condensin MukBEF ATPase and DNA-binding subunit MukB
MAKEKKVDLKAVAMQEMETMVEQHNELVKSIQEQQGRLNEVKTMLTEKTGYLKGLEDCDANCEKDA